MAPAESASVRAFLSREVEAIPPSTLAARIGSWDRPAILESGAVAGVSGWSVLAAEPRWVFEARGSAWSLRGDGVNEQGSDNPLGRLERLIRTLGLDRHGPEGVNWQVVPPFRGGLIGHFGYDLAPLLERLPRKAEPDSRLPDIRLGLYDTFAIHDQFGNQVTLHAVDFLDEGRAACRDRLDRWSEMLRRPAKPVKHSTPREPLTSRFTPEAYREAVRRTLEYIRAGDIFQVNLSQRFEGLGEWSPLDLFLRLRRRSPAPYAAFLAWDDLALVSSSPEAFYQTREDEILTRPIKGTRPRGSDPTEDARLIAELVASPKDRAELTMIVDLERNDLGRICEYGSVRVVEEAAVESFAQVHHLVATVAGKLRPETGPIDVVRAMFPGGSITGAPKIRAMEIIDELEPNRRSVYTGAIGYISQNASGFNIAIRTILVEGERASFQVGGGIVADSDPEAEYQETLHKGAGLRAVLEETPPS